MSIAMFIFQREEEHLYCDTCPTEEMGYLRNSREGYIHRCDNCGSTVAADKVFPCSENYPLVFER